MAAITKLNHDSETYQYAENRRAEGKADKEIRRCIKRFMVRRVFRTLAAAAQAKRHRQRFGRHKRAYGG